ncbi:ATP-binding protein [Bradyrhizobium sp. LA7.1]|uniref:ATP-binding protein n=1 Tax=Bradyrhizobium sp. LA7.1 TaxID=3156324 RepID=UPI003391EEB4
MRTPSERTINPRSSLRNIKHGHPTVVRAGRRSKVAVKVTLKSDQNIICVEDNAGGLRRRELRYIVGPGQTGSAPTDETIGIFGVGTKRAVVALAQDVKISTRFGNDDTFQVDFDENWLEEEDWELPLYQVDNIAPSTTIVELQKLRVKISDEVIDQLREHLSVTFAKFLSTNGVSISLNGKALKPQFFDGWSYPPGYEPRRYHGVLKTAEGRDVRVEAIAGLSDESSPAGGEYGVYFYCNERLIARALKTFEVGFMKGYAGLPHPKVSLTKVLVSLSGDASSMPWNSSKSDISTKHEVFQALHTWLTQAVKDYAALSRIWMGEWPDKVFKYAEGKVVDVPVDDFPTAKKSYLPPMPKSRPRYGDVITDVDKGVAKKKPWVKGTI